MVSFAKVSQDAAPEKKRIRMMLVQYVLPFSDATTNALGTQPDGISI